MNLSTEYIDTKGVEAFNSLGEEDVDCCNPFQYLECSRSLPLSDSRAFDSFIKHIWELGGHLKAQVNAVVIEERGHGQGRLGARRRLTGGIREEIISVGVPSSTSAVSSSVASSLPMTTSKRQPNEEVLPQGQGSSSSYISSVSYAQIGGPLPVKDYHAFVSFIPMSPTEVLVRWQVKFRPTWIGQALCCGGALIRIILRYAFNLILQEFYEHSVASKDKTRDKRK